MIANSPPIFMDYLYPNAAPLKLRGARFFIEARDPSGVQIRKNGAPMAYQQPGILVAVTAAVCFAGVHAISDFLKDNYSELSSFMTPLQTAPAKVGMISLGCAKNLVDAEIMLGGVLARGMQVTNDPGEADALIINTCAFIDSAKEESVRGDSRGAPGARFAQEKRPETYRERLHGAALCEGVGPRIARG
jgi:hypothetical protein